MVAAACVSSGSALAADDSPSIIESTRGRVTLADFEAELDRLPPASRAQFAANRQRVMQLLNNLFLNRAASAEARAAGLDKDPAIVRQIEFAVEKLLAQAQFDKVDRDLGAAFDANPGKYLPRAREVYAMQPEKFRSPEKVRVSHILVRVRGGREDEAKARAEELRAKVAAGAAFADVARESSDDPNAKRNGGDLGFIVAAGMDPPFATAAFALQTPGELSPLVRGASGYHVIQFQERRPSGKLTFDEVRPAIMAEIRQNVIETERSAYQSALVAEPEPKVNDKLIDKVVNDARVSAMSAPGAPPPIRR